MNTQPVEIDFKSENKYLLRLMIAQTSAEINELWKQEVDKCRDLLILRNRLVEVSDPKFYQKQLERKTAGKKESGESLFKYLEFME